jgi:hypothetical protein
VLYREGWGRKGWTGVEETAIKNHGMEHGWNSVLMIPLEEKPTIPKWVPSGQIWLSYPHYGLTATLPVIERMLETLGGAAKPVTAATHLARQARHNGWLKEREAKRNSEKEGVAVAQQHAAALLAELEKTLANEPTADIAFRKSGSSARIWTTAPERDGTTVTVTWRLPYSNVLENSVLDVTLWDGYASLYGEYIPSHSQPRERATHEFDFEWSEARQWVWQHRKTKRGYDITGVAAFCIGLLIDHSRRSPKR